MMLIEPAFRQLEHFISLRLLHDKTDGKRKDTDGLEMNVGSLLINARQRFSGACFRCHQCSSPMRHPDFCTNFI